MKKILILGSTGMLGWQTLKLLQDLKNFQIFATYKSKRKLELLKKKILINKRVKFLNFDINKPKKIKFSNFHYIINCVGIIKPYINEKNQDSVKNAIQINSLFPHSLIKNNNFSKVFQIATDCVFDGNKGNYLEHEIHNALDVYGKTKSLGEIKSKNFFNIRCSIIGPELDNHLSLLDWFKYLPLNSKVFGFANHEWNGLTTYAFAKVIRAIIKKNIKIPNSIHLVPKNRLNKFQLLKTFKEKLKRKDVVITKKNSKIKINRTIRTSKITINKKIWKLAGYSNIPTIQYLIRELS